VRTPQSFFSDLDYFFEMRVRAALSFLDYDVEALDSFHAVPRIVSRAPPDVSFSRPVSVGFSAARALPKTGRPFFFELPRLFALRAGVIRIIDLRSW